MAHHLEREEESRLSKNAYKVYGSLALLVYLLALTYCYSTERYYEMGAIALIVAVMGGIVAMVYRKL